MVESRPLYLYSLHQTFKNPNPNSGDQQMYCNWSCWDHECLYQISLQAIQCLCRFFTLDKAKNTVRIAGKLFKIKQKLKELFNWCNCAGKNCHLGLYLSQKKFYKQSNLHIFTANTHSLYQPALVSTNQSLIHEIKPAFIHGYIYFFLSGLIKQKTESPNISSMPRASLALWRTWSPSPSWYGYQSTGG